MLPRFVRKNRARLWCFTFLLLPLFAHAARQVSLEWDASSDPTVTGYKVRYGTASETYTNVLDVGNITSATISNLPTGATFYFAVTAYRADAMESVASNEVSYISPAFNPPTVKITSPADGIKINGPVAVTVDAQVTDPDGALSRVELYQGSSKLGDSAAAPFSAVTSTLPDGQYSFSAVAVDRDGGRWPSAPVSINVVKLSASSGGFKKLANGSFQFNVSGAAGSSVRIWYSNDLINWNVLSTVTNSTGSQTIVDPNASKVPKRFYKITSP